MLFFHSFLMFTVVALTSAHAWTSSDHDVRITITYTNTHLVCPCATDVLVKSTDKESPTTWEEWGQSTSSVRKPSGTTEHPEGTKTTAAGKFHFALNRIVDQQLFNFASDYPYRDFSHDLDHSCGIEQHHFLAQQPHVKQHNQQHYNYNYNYVHDDNSKHHHDNLYQLSTDIGTDHDDYPYHHYYHHNNNDNHDNDYYYYDYYNHYDYLSNTDILQCRPERCLRRRMFL
ncbi:hypothetical protein H2200_008527 [Cladophialophora chaetospira]|uniref:Uncharacterized protein n=1 Tax=Cladophialophora chaetospira TaxID=386627 RepID=A0AA38X6C7_9EURO|nr:hypothetical protein H2200_008527 [Cladophialophora chaetospira]